MRIKESLDRLLEAGKITQTQYDAALSKITGADYLE